MHPFERFLQRRTTEILLYRFARHNQLIDERREMRIMARLIEIKGLGADIAAVKKGIGELRSAATELNTEKTGLTAEIKDLTEQLKQHRADLRFEAETLGNSSGGSDEEQAKLVQSPPEVAEVPPQTFRAAE